MQLSGKKILLTGGAGFLGSFVLQSLLRRGVQPSSIRVPRSREEDLRQWDSCRRAVDGVDLVIHLAARVGGIGYNRRNPATIFYDNIVMGVQLMEAACRSGVAKFVQVGTVCAYPKAPPLPFREESLWDGYPEQTNAPYGIAKKSLLVQAQAYRDQYGFNAIYLLPTNLYGPGDNFDPEDSHVIPALIRKCIDAAATSVREVHLWGTGTPSREFLYVEDCAEAVVLAAEGYDGRDPVNLGSGQEVTIRDLAALVAEECGFAGTMRWESSQPDGQPRRCLNTERARSFGFQATTPLREGLRRTINWYRARHGAPLGL